MSASADAARWTPGSPAWVTHEQLQAENCQLRNDRDRLRAAVAALEREMRTDPDLMRRAAYWADRLAARLTETP